MQKDNINRPGKGLHTDNSYGDAPKDTYRFALNAVNETELGDFAFLSNEESNEICDSLTPTFIPIGKVYLSDSEIIVFSVSQDETISEIGILNNACVYTPHVNDEDSLAGDKLNFKIAHQIQATYRLRRGCERTVYFTDDYNKPRYYNFDKPEDFQDGTGAWIGKKFNLIKEYSSIPEFANIEVLNSGGVLTPGSYNIAVQYVDEGLNPTEWMVTSDIIAIYNDRTTEAFLDIQGSINNEGTDYENFPNTTKAIKVTLAGLDTAFAFYRLAFIEATNGTGFVSDVKKTQIIPTSKDFFIYTGENVVENGLEEEILFFNEVIYKANSIEQIENRLILGNTQGKQVDFCKLQKYASRIKADVITRKVVLNDITDLANPKNPIVRTIATGYMPGEIYSFGIVYVFEDGTLSPTYHIPGKSNLINPTTTFTTGSNIYPMSIRNESLNNRYIDNDNCSNGDYWGLDSEGNPLKNELVRHHRFPKRSEIGKNLVDEEPSNPNSFTYYRLKVDWTGTIDLPCTQDQFDLGQCPVVQEAPPFGVNIYYTVDGVNESFTIIIDPADYSSNPISDFLLSPYYTSNSIVITKIEEEQVDGTVLDVTSPPYVYPSPRGLDYSTSIIDSTYTLENKVYTTDILGIKFSGVDIPTLADTNGDQIIGYYIVRNNRTENEKTILDSGVMVPSVINTKYISHGLLTPEIDPTKIDKRVYGFIHPEHKFNNIQYDDYDAIEQEGNFNITTKNYSKTRYNDVLDGSSYNSDKQKEGNDDGRTMDGFSLAIIVRDAYTQFIRSTSFTILRNQIKSIFYLNALESRDIDDGVSTAYNIAADNKVGMIQTNQDDLVDIQNNNLPYVLLRRDIADSYSNFRLLPYYKDSDNLEISDTATVFGGDSYVSPMRYVNTIFWDNRLALRKGQTSALSYILGAVLIVVGIVLLIFSAGTSSALIVGGAGVALAGAGAVYIASGIKQDTWNKAYNEEWYKGLRETALDDWVNAFYKVRTTYFGWVGNAPTGQDGPSDDEIEWIGDCVTDLWFESKVNIQLRNKMTSDISCFLDAPGVKESGNDEPTQTWEFFNLWYEDSVSRYPISKLETHLNKKLLTYNSKRKDNREYLGIPMGEYYRINPDYTRINSQKVFFHLPLEYDCCSDCKEDFPHRVHYSEQSFQEELTDNYRVFLPNNYRDLEGESGEITNIFKIGNNLFIHTREGLWQMPRSYQERITDQIVSFIGTGSFFEIPAQKVIDDDNGSSAGLQHKWSALKTLHGYLFVCESQRMVYLFNGKDLKTLSNIGMSNYFKEETRLKINEQYYASTGKKYKYDDNPSNPYGAGFITTYDTKKERFIVTKKDFQLSDVVIGNSDFEISILDGQMVIFYNFDQTIYDEGLDGWNYIGIEDGRMKFEKIITSTRTETREITANINGDTDIIIWLDTSVSFDNNARQTIKDAVDSWLDTFQTANPGWQGNLHYLDTTLPSRSERWLIALEDAKNNIYGGNIDGKDIILVSFVNEAVPAYHTNVFDGDIDNPAFAFLPDYTSFIDIHDNEIIANGGSFSGLIYPIVFNGDDETAEFLQHALAAVNGIPFTLMQANALLVNPAVSNWNLMKSSLQTANPYPDNGVGGLNQYGWQVITNRYWDGTGLVITENQFAGDMNEFVGNEPVKEEIEVEVSYQETIYKYIDGVVLNNPIENNNSWTMSFSLKQDTWTSWHSYLPSFYMNVPEKFYSWRYGNDNIWIHNKKYNYQTYYGDFKPHIIEYVSLSTPLVTRIWNHIKLLTEAKVFDVDTQQYWDQRFITFNKAILYNSRQCSGLMELLPKDTQPNSEDYLSQQIVNTNDNKYLIDRTERDWHFNDLRDIRIDYTKPIWDNNIISLQSNYYIDKVLNTITMDIDKDWTQLESFRDKYLVIRLIFDNFANVKLITNYSAENEQQSFI